MLFRKSYSYFQVLAVLSITVGVVITTLTEAQLKAQTLSCDNCFLFFQFNNTLSNQSVLSLFTGVGLLSLSVFLLSFYGFYQAYTFETYISSTEEMLFYTHFMSIPFFLSVASDIKKHFILFNLSKPVTLLNVEVPILWIYTFINTITQFICVKGISNINKKFGSLTSTAATTVRKFISLLISIIFF